MNIWPIAWTTFRENIRNRVFIVVVVFAVALVATTTLYGTLYLQSELDFTRNTGLAVMQILSMLIVVFVASNTVRKELDTQTIQVLLAKPVKREQFIIGKFLGVFLIVLLNMVLMGIGLVFVVAAKHQLLNFGLVKAMAPMCLEMAVMTSIAIFLAVITGELLGPIFSICIFALGHLTQLLPYILAKANLLAVKILGWIVYYVFPNLSHFDLKNQVVRNLSIPGPLYGGMFFYAAIYCTIMLLLASLAFKTKEIT